MPFVAPSSAAQRIATYLIAASAICTGATGLFSSAWAVTAPTSSMAPGVPVPQEVMQALGTVRSQGQARLVVFGFNIYDAKLWTQEGFTPAQYESQLFALELRYLRNFSGDALAERSLKEMRRLGEISDDKAEQWLASMRKTFPDVKKGDQLIGIHQADGSARFVLNGKPIGEVRDAEFTRLFFGIWLSPKTSEPKMRRALIGAASPGAKP